MVLTRRMLQMNIHGEVSSVLRDIVSRVAGTKKVSFSTNVVLEKRQYLVSKKMRKTPKRINKSVHIPRKKYTASKFSSFTQCELKKINTPILCRTTPIPLSLVWKVAEEMKQKNMINPKLFDMKSEKPHFSPDDSDEDDLYD